MTPFTVEPIGVVRASRTVSFDDDWDAVESRIELDPDALDADATLGLDAFSHIEVVYLFHLADTSAACRVRAIREATRTGLAPASWPSERRTGRTASASRCAGSSASGSARSWYGASMPSTARRCST